MRTAIGITLGILIMCLVWHPSAAAEDRDPVPFKVDARLRDLAEPVLPGRIQLQGWLGNRVANNAEARLPKVDLEPLLAGFRAKPGTHPWIGEHIGKWMHAATLTWANTGSPELRKKLDYAAAEVIKAQEPDGYLGTYVSTQRFGLYPNADWDVWSHKYCLIGLLTYHQFTGDKPSLAASIKAGDLLIQTFGPGKKSILSAGTHVGMAATSILEPMVLLYRFTGDERYLELCRQIVAAYDKPNGPKIVATLLDTGRTDKTANGKAYEMLSNLVGLCELARATGDRKLVKVALEAWDDIVQKRLYITGSASQGELFRDDHFLPNDAAAHIAETCVTTTWIQLNSQLLRLTGEARFGDELERAFYNHLSAAQHPDGTQWCYYTPTEGRKEYGPGISCCVSSGPRGMALIPQHACVLLRPTEAAPETVAICLMEDFKAHIQVGGRDVALAHETKVTSPVEASSTISFTGSGTPRFALAFRKAPWMVHAHISIGGSPLDVTVSNGWMVLPPREWRRGDQAMLTMGIANRVIGGTHSNRGKAALVWGPMVLAYDAHQNQPAEHPVAIALASPAGPPPIDLASDSSAELVRFSASIRSVRNPKPHPAIFVPFADAGAAGGVYRVWMAGPEVDLPKEVHLSLTATESRSRNGNVPGSINDQDLSSFVVTFDNRKRDQDWFALTLDEPSSIQKVSFAHGKTFHDGGWFDASSGKPRLQIQRPGSQEWESLGEFTDYPATTSTDSNNLREGQLFELILKRPVAVKAVRIIGKPASGDNASQAFSSCAELRLSAKE